MGKTRPNTDAPDSTPATGMLPVAAIVLSILGIALGVTGLYIHQEIASSQGAYSSFCDVNQEMSCDAVLGSSHATFLGTPVASWGILGWLVALGLSFWTFGSTGRDRITRATYVLALAGVILSISLYYLVVSIVLIGVFCPICLSMDATALAFFAVAAVQVRLLQPGAPKSWQPKPLLGGAALAALVAIGVLVAGQEDPVAVLDGSVTGSQIRRDDPRFYVYYTSQPVMEQPLPAGISADGAGISVVEFSDFQCPHCRRSFFDLERAIGASDMKIEVYHRNFPLHPDCNPAVQGIAHDMACDAAFASWCAHEVGKGHEFDRALFANQKTLSPQSIPAIGKSLGMNVEDLESCVDSSAARDAIQIDLAAGNALGIASTPTIFINGRMLKGGITPQQFLYAFAIERDLQASENGSN
jgi:protein-disulfide isomerase